MAFNRTRPGSVFSSVSLMTEQAHVVSCIMEAHARIPMSYVKKTDEGLFLMLNDTVVLCASIGKLRGSHSCSAWRNTDYTCVPLVVYVRGTGLAYVWAQNERRNWVCFVTFKEGAKVISALDPVAVEVVRAIRAAYPSLSQGDEAPITDAVLHPAWARLGAEPVAPDAAPPPAVESALIPGARCYRGLDLTVRDDGKVFVNHLSKRMSVLPASGDYDIVSYRYPTNGKPSDVDTWRQLDAKAEAAFNTLLFALQEGMVQTRRLCIGSE